MKRRKKTPAKAPTKRTPNASPQDQALYNQVMLAARRVIYGDPNDDSRFKMILERFARGKSELGNTIGQTAATIIANVQGAIQKAGKQVPSYILFHAGMEVVAELVQIAVKAKLATQAQSGALCAQAVQAAVATYKQAQAHLAGQGQQPPAPAAQAPTPAAPPPQPPGLVNTARMGA